MPSDENYEPKPFTCEYCGWTIGEKYRDPNERITRLRVYVQARAPESGILGNGTQIYYSVIGLNDGLVVCRNCTRITSWVANQSAIKELLERRTVRRVKVSDGKIVE